MADGAQAGPEAELQAVFKHLRSGSTTELDVLAFDRGAVYRDGRIDMCKQVVGPTYIDDLTRELWLVTRQRSGQLAVQNSKLKSIALLRGTQDG